MATAPDLTHVQPLGFFTERLADAADDEERRHQQPDLREAEREVRHQPGKQRRQQQLKEMRGAVREAHEADDRGVAARFGRAQTHLH